MCPACHELCMTWPLTTPLALSAALRLARGFVADGTLAVDADAASQPMPPFAEVEPQGPWSDDLEYHFHCRRCGERFTLFVETHQGSSGQWFVEP